MMDFKEISGLISVPGNITILIHKNPDGDAIGASLGLYHYLLKLNHTVRVISPNDFPAFLKWLPSSENILNAHLTPDVADKFIQKSNIIFCVDFNALERIGNLKDSFNKSKAYKILIDHHPNPDIQCNSIYSKTETSSASELIYDFIINTNGKDKIDKIIAECIYVGIMTDTGSFSYSCNMPETYLATAELIKMGLDVQHIHNLIYDTYSENRMRLLGFSLNTAMKVFPEYSAAYIALSKKDLMKFKHQMGDTEGFVNYPISMKDIKLSALFMEMNDQIKISFRSKGNFDVNEFARKHFNGGGHKNASGAKSKDSIKEVTEKFENLLAQYRDKLLN